MKRAKKQEKLNRLNEIEKEEELLLDTSREPEMPEDFERLLLGSPNDSFLWIKKNGVSTCRPMASSN